MVYDGLVWERGVSMGIRLGLYADVKVKQPSSFLALDIYRWTCAVVGHGAGDSN